MSARHALAACLVIACAAPALAEPARAPTADAAVLPNGLALPYPTLRVFRAFGRCRRSTPRPDHWPASAPWRSHDHEGIDLGGLGPDGGLGTAVRSLTRARVVEIAHGDDLPPKFGVTDRRPGEAIRDEVSYPRSFALAGYGLVHFFTRTRGWFRTGNMVVTVGLEGRLEDHVIRYMHLGAARPDLKVGDVLAPGEELGVLGGTGVQQDAPHLHLDIRDPDGEAVDVAPLIGLRTSAWCGVPRKVALEDRRDFLAAAAERDWRPDAWAPPVGRPDLGGRALAPIDLLRTPIPLVAAGIVPPRSRFWHDVIVPAPCSPYVVEEDFTSGAYAGHAWRLRVTRGQSFDLKVSARDASASPRFAIVDQATERLFYPLTDPRAPDPILTVSTVASDHVRLEAGATTEVLLAVIGADPYRITLSERCAMAR